MCNYCYGTEAQQIQVDKLKDTGCTCSQYLGNVFVNVGQFLSLCLSLRVDVHDLLLHVRHNVNVYVHLASHRRDRLTGTVT